MAAGARKPGGIVRRAVATSCEARRLTATLPNHDLRPSARGRDHGAAVLSPAAGLVPRHRIDRSHHLRDRVLHVLAPCCQAATATHAATCMAPPSIGVYMRRVMTGYDDVYRDFESPLTRQLRLEAYGTDIGQHSWVTVDELRSDLAQTREEVTEKARRARAVAQPLPSPVHSLRVPAPLGANVKGTGVDKSILLRRSRIGATARGPIFGMRPPAHEGRLIGPGLVSRSR